MTTAAPTRLTPGPHVVPASTLLASPHYVEGALAHLHERNIERLVASMHENGYDQALSDADPQASDPDWVLGEPTGGPIRVTHGVDGLLYVIEGHHRVHAAIVLALDIPVVVE